MSSYRRLVIALSVAVVAVAGGGAYVLRNVADTPAPRAVPSSPAPSVSPLPSVSPVVERTPGTYAAEPDPAAPPLSAAVARALAKPFADPALGSRVNAFVMEAGTGETLYDRGGDIAVVPASTTKLFTAVAALKQLGPDRRLTTRVLARGTVADGTLTGDLVVLGGGDPTLTEATTPLAYPQPARLADLAAQVRAKGIRRVTGSLLVDTSLFTGPRLGPGWKPTYVTEGSVAPVVAFEVDAGRPAHDATGSRVQRPEITGGSKLAAALRRAGVSVGVTVAPGIAAESDVEVAEVESPPVSALIERLLIRSDNDLAEALARHVAVDRGLTADFTGAAQGMADALRELDLDPPVLYDASGLSRRNAVTPAQMVRVLAVATSDPALSPVAAGLPVSAFSGTLSSRYTTPATRLAAGRVRAKTGTLDNVTTLAGFVVTASGDVLVFGFAADRLPTRFAGAAARALDAAVAALARCGCAA